MMYYWAMKLSGGLLAVSIFLSILLWWTLPGTESVAIHFNGSGKPDRMVSIGTAAVLLPAAIALVWIVFFFQARRASGSLSTSTGILWIGVVGILAIAHAVVVAKALGSGVNPAIAIGGALTVIAIVAVASWRYSGVN